MFEDRTDAGNQLAQKLEIFRGEDAVIIALPRGGVVVGSAVALKLSLPLDIIVTRKMGHQNNPECALCAVDEKGTLLCDEVEAQAVDKKWLHEETERQRKEARRRTLVYRRGRKPIELAGRTAIITDDGVATGLTMRLAIAVARTQRPKRIIVAVPVAPADVVQKMKQEADEVIILKPPEEFLGAVGAHYEHFDQVEDDEVVRLLNLKDPYS